jgi:hypothetical protein
MVAGFSIDKYRNLSKAEEEEFLAKFEQEAEEGHVVTVGKIKEAYDGVTGKIHKSPSTAYYMLHNNGWRKVVPRQEHPDKASEEVMDASKKLTII